MNIVEEINKGEMERISQERPIPEFAPGDTLKVHVKVVEGTRESCLLYTSPSPRDISGSRMPSSA